jgi:hypothetical protein
VKILQIADHDEVVSSAQSKFYFSASGMSINSDKIRRLAKLVSSKHGLVQTSASGFQSQPPPQLGRWCAYLA